MPFDWVGKWKVKTVNVNEGGGIGLIAAPPSKFTIEKSANGEKFFLKSMVYMAWEPPEIELRDYGEGVAERFEAEFTLDDQGPHTARLKAIENSDEIEVNVSPAKGGTGRGTATSGRG